MFPCVFTDVLPRCSKQNSGFLPSQHYHSHFSLMHFNSQLWEYANKSISAFCFGLRYVLRTILLIVHVYCIFMHISEQHWSTLTRSTLEDTPLECTQVALSILIFSVSKNKQSPIWSIIFGPSVVSHLASVSLHRSIPHALYCLIVEPLTCWGLWLSCWTISTIHWFWLRNPAPAGNSYTALSLHSLPICCIQNMVFQHPSYICIPL